MFFPQTISTLPFRDWLWKDKENKQFFYLSTIIMVISFGSLKYIYPFPNFIPPDSYSYLEAADKNSYINIWPIGYSKFLQLVGIFGHSHVILVIVQYLFLMGSALYFLFTIRYLLSIDKWIFMLLLLLTLLNPLLVHIANFVSSDCLFAALSLVWITQLLWIICQPRLKLLIIHAIVLLVASSVRYTAFWYPFISIITIVFTNLSGNIKWLGIASIVMMNLIFIGFTQYNYRTETDTVQYAAFGGWQTAANALYGYAHARHDDSGTMPGKFKALHNIVNRHMDSISRLGSRPDQDIGVYYLWDFKSPLVLYMNRYEADPKKTHFAQWCNVAPLYGAYGRWLILKYPLPFIKHYVLPNLLRYYEPPPNFMGLYNLGNNRVDPIAVKWFNWKNNQLPSRRKNRTIYIMNLSRKLFAIINPVFILSTIYYICFSGINQESKTNRQIIFFILMVWFSNLVFSVLSAPIELRYQIFPVVFTLPFSILLIAWIIESLNYKPAGKQTSSNQLSKQP